MADVSDDGRADASNVLGTRSVASEDVFATNVVMSGAPAELVVGTDGVSRRIPVATYGARRENDVRRDVVSGRPSVEEDVEMVVDAGTGNASR